MSAPAIRVSGLGKRYRIGERMRYKSLRESISNAVTTTFRGTRRTEETIWALKDVSFEVAPGEVVAVIGRNGAGKSTVLKILSRITEPTEGRVELHGRVGSLLEVGTGFHLELTGRDNIYLNGAILGMKRAEILRKFDEIVAFAEVEKFIDTPVKHYSTGMHLRLAFAVAAHLEPEILLVDEVLAVGDAAFQNKCLGKMGEVARTGRTVLLVSHNMGSALALADRGLLFQDGHLVSSGAAGEIVARYLATPLAPTTSSLASEREACSLPICILRASTTDLATTVRSQFDLREPILIQIEYNVLPNHRELALSLIVRRQGIDVFLGFDTDQRPERLQFRESGNQAYRVAIAPGLLKPGTYTVSLSSGLLNQQTLQRLEDVLTFDVTANLEDTSRRGYARWRRGVVVAHLDWMDAVPTENL